MSREPRRYVNAQPTCDWVDHWPTDEQMWALQEAKRQVLAQRRGGYRLARVKVPDGSQACASVLLNPGGNFDAHILIEQPSGEPSIFIKSWYGVPEWENQETAMTRYRIPAGDVHISAPGPQVHYVPEEIHIVRQRRIHHHNRPDEHIHHGQPNPLHIDMEPSRVAVEYGQTSEHHHQPKRGFWGTLLLGPEKQSREEDRGTLQTVGAPQRQQTPALTHQPQPSPTWGQSEPMPLALPAPSANRTPQLAYQPEPQFEMPPPRKRGLFSWS